MIHKKRLLIITHSYFPDNNPRSYRWTSIAEELFTKDFLVDVVCACDANTNDKKNEKKINVFYVQDFNKKSKLFFNHSFKKNNFILTFFKRILLFFRWPDYAMFWILPAIIESNKLLKKNNYDCVISVAHPFSSHVVAYLLNLKKYKIKWICDYGDPYSIDNFSKNKFNISTFFNKIIEKHILKNVDIITVTNLQTKHLYVLQLKIRPDIIKIINPLLSFVPKYLGESFINYNKPIKFVYAGTLYKKIRNPLYLLHVFSDLLLTLPSTQFSLHFYGDLGDCRDLINFDTDNIFYHGYVSRSDLFNKLDSQTILVNIENLSTFQTPSKIVEYISTGLPILNIKQTFDDNNANNVIGDYNKLISININNDTLNSVNSIIFFLQKKDRSLSNANYITTPFLLDNIVNKYIEII